MVFSNINLLIDVEIAFQDKIVEFVTCYKHLGITFDSNGKFHTHIFNIIKSASQRLYALRKLKYVLNRPNEGAREPNDDAREPTEGSREPNEDAREPNEGAREPNEGVI